MSLPARLAAAWALASVLALAATGVLLAQDPETPGGEEAAAGTTPPAAGEPDAAEAAAEDTPPPGPPSSEDFIPTERIPADASIAFPVDI